MASQEVTKRSEVSAWRRIIRKARKRFMEGGEEYGWGNWLKKDNLQDLEEELLDGIVYLVLTLRKIEYLRDRKEKA